MMTSTGVMSPPTLSDEQVAVIASAADMMAKTLPHYAPKPLNMKKQVDREIQVSRNTGIT